MTWRRSVRLDDEFAREIRASFIRNRIEDDCLDRHAIRGRRIRIAVEVHGPAGGTQTGRMLLSDEVLYIWGPRVVGPRVLRVGFVSVA